jgi:hypothetical protein
MEIYGIPGKLIRMVKTFHEKSESTVESNGEDSEWFEFKTRVKQGFVMSAFLFLLVINWVRRKTTTKHQYPLEFHKKAR